MQTSVPPNTPPGEHFLNVPGCVPLLRKSHSAPASLLLDNCLKKTTSLHEKLDQLTDQIRERSKSVVELSGIALEELPVFGDMVCHGCHGEIGSGAHIGSATGKNLCKIPHSSSCPGGVVEDGSWRACSTDQVVGQDVAGLGHEQYMGIDGHTSESDLLRFHQQAHGEGARERHPGMVHVDHVNGGLGDSALGGVNPHDVLPSAVEEQVRLLRAQNQQAQQLGTSGGDVQLSIADIRKIPGMQDLVANQMDKFQEIIPALSSAASGSHPPLAETNLVPGFVTLDPKVQGLDSGQSDELSKSEAEYTELVAKQKQVEEAIKAQSEQLNMQQQQPVANQFTAPTPLSVGAQTSPAPPMPQVSALPPSDVLQRELSLQQREQQRLQEALQIQKQQFDALLLQQQQQAALFAAQKLKFEQEQTAAKVCEQKEKNARVAAELRAAEQALANPQLRQFSTPRNQSHFQPQSQQSLPSSTAHVGNSGRVSVPVMDGAAACDLSFTPVYEFFRRPDGSIYKVMKMPSFQQASHGNSLPSGQHHNSSPTLNQPGPQPAMSTPGSAFLEWRVNQETGVPYQVLVQPTLHKFQHSTQLGTPYQQQQNRHDIQQLPGQSIPQPQPYRSPQYPQATGQQSGVMSGPGNTSVAQQLKDRVAGIVSLVESGGESKQLKLLDHVRSCPAKWAKKVTLDNMNLPVYAYGVTSELTSSLSGRSPAMSPDVLISKLQHLQNTLGVCCLNTTEKEFSNYGWVLARDYAMKVQDRVTQNLTSWEKLSSEVQTSDLVASQMEFPRPVEKKVQEKKEEKKQPLCSTWNTCKTEKKCQYELDHPGRSCLRKHECSHCREELKQSHRHQLWKCPNK